MDLIELHPLVIMLRVLEFSVYHTFEFLSLFYIGIILDLTRYQVKKRLSKAN